MMQEHSHGLNDGGLLSDCLVRVIFMALPFINTDE